MKLSLKFVHIFLLKTFCKLNYKESFRIWGSRGCPPGKTESCIYITRVAVKLAWGGAPPPKISKIWIFFLKIIWFQSCCRRYVQVQGLCLGPLSMFLPFYNSHLILPALTAYLELTQYKVKQGILPILCGGRSQKISKILIFFLQNYTVPKFLQNAYIGPEVVFGSSEYVFDVLQFISHVTGSHRLPEG